MKTHVDLIERWGIRPFAEAIGVTYTHAQLMKWRNSVPPDYWPAVVDDAAKRGWSDITPDLLMRLRKGRQAMGEGQGNGMAASAA